MVKTVTPYRTIALFESLKGFRIVKALGKGGMGNVFEAVTPNGCNIALKIFHPTILSSIAHGEDIFSDLEIAVQVKHPNLCGLLDFYRDEQIVFLTNLIVLIRIIHIGG